MTLPDLSKLSAYELMELAASPLIYTELLINHRRSEGRQDNSEFSLEEQLWLGRIAYGRMIKEALSTIPLEEVLRALGKPAGLLRKKGRPADYIYWEAWMHMQINNLKPMQAYYRVVQPYFLETGQLSKNKRGEPDPIQDKLMQENFQKAIAGFRENARKKGI